VEDADAASRDLQLEVIINDFPTDLIGRFHDEDGRLSATPTELESVGLAVPKGTEPDADGRVALDQLPEVKYTFEERMQRIRFTVGEEAQQPHVVKFQDRTEPAAHSGLGLVLNYDVLGTRSLDSTGVDGAFEGRLFSSYGVLSSGFLGSYDESGNRNRFVRLDTTYTYSDPDAMTRLRFGDVISGGLSWTRPVRLGGAQFSRDFGLRPDLITFPTPTLAGSASVPSTVDVFINDVQQGGRDVPPGPFQINDLPIITGAGDAKLVVRDALGRETVQTVAFYASPDLLAEGRLDFSLEAGSLRRDFGTSSDSYKDIAASATARYGLTNSLTLESHVEGTRDVIAGGAGVHLALGSYGVVSGSLAASSGHGSSGLQYGVGYQYQAGRWSVGAASTWTGGDYQDVAAQFDDPVPRRLDRANLGLNLGGWGSVSVGYLGVDYGREDRDRSLNFVTSSYTTNLFENVTLYASAYADIRDGDNYGVTVGLAIPFGGDISTSADVSRQSGANQATAQAYKSVPIDGGWGWQLLDSEGGYSRRLAEGRYRSGWGEVQAGVDQFDDQVSGRAGVRGALVAAAGGVFATNWIDNGFGIVDIGYPDVEVLRENRPVGRTGSSGMLIVPDLNPYQSNKLSIDPLSVPYSASIGRVERDAVPEDRSGVVVEFPVQDAKGALLTLVGPDGKPLPVGSVAQLDGRSETAPVGYDGQVYLTGLDAWNAITVKGPFGSCTASFAYEPSGKVNTVIGPVPCR